MFHFICVDVLYFFFLYSSLSFKKEFHSLLHNTLHMVYFIISKNDIELLLKFICDTENAIMLLFLLLLLILHSTFTLNELGFVMRIIPSPIYYSILFILFFFSFLMRSVFIID